MTATTLDELREAAVDIIRRVLAKGKWLDLDDLGAFVPDDLASAWAALDPLVIREEPGIRMRRSRSAMSTYASLYLYHREGGYEFKVTGSGSTKMRRRPRMPRIDPARSLPR